MNYLISILINNYNYGRFLGRAIDSALMQSYPHCEVVVVDDGSTDNSRDIIRSYGARVRPVFKENGGQGSAYNAGFAESTGEIIMLLDSDDYLKPDAAERIASAWNDEVQILHHRVQIVDPAGREVGHWPSTNDILDSGDVVPILLKKGLYSGPPSSGLVYGRRLLQQLLPMPEEDFRISADAWLFLQAPFLAPVTALDETLACYLSHGSNNWGLTGLTRFSNRARLEAFTAARSRNLDLVAKQAAAHGFSISDPLQWENSFTLRWKLILMRLNSTPSTWETRVSMFRDILKKIRFEPHTSWESFRQRCVCLFILLGPRVLLRVMFPNMFAS